MKRSLQSGARRGAFTLIELLVVMAIIGVLVSLTTAAVMRFLVKGPEIQNRADMTGLAQALAAFQQEFGVNYVPSRLKLIETGAYDTTQALDRDSSAYLQRIFGRRAVLTQDWNGNGRADAPAILEGHMVLVFLTGGIPSAATPNGCLGFSTSPTNPAAPPAAAGETRRGPFFTEFKANRLRREANGFFSYLDPWKKQPYAFFSSYKGSNGYSRYGSSDCASLGVSPYSINGTNPTRFFNSDGYQLISAGPDGLFGPGGGIDPAAGVTTGNGRDDFSNFHSRRLSAGPIE